MDSTNLETWIKHDFWQFLLPFREWCHSSFLEHLLLNSRGKKKKKNQKETPDISISQQAHLKLLQVHINNNNNKQGHS